MLKSNIHLSLFNSSNSVVVDMTVIIAIISVTLWHPWANEPVAGALIQLPDASATCHDIPLAPRFHAQSQRHASPTLLLVARHPSTPTADRMWPIGHVTPPLRRALEIRMSSALPAPWNASRDLIWRHITTLQWAAFSTAVSALRF